MTLKAGRIAFTAQCEHVIGLIIVAGVAGEAGELAALVARGFYEAVEFATAHANHAVGPEEVAQQFRVFSKVVSETGNTVGGRSPNDRRRFFEVVAGAEGEAVAAPIFAVINPFHGVTEAAGLRGAFGGELFGMDDFVGCKAGGGGFGRIEI